MQSRMKDAYWTARLTGSPIMRPKESRTAYQRDRARLIHSAAFRRLQGKTQVLGLGDSDFYRSRLTHSMETAQIGAGLVNNIRHVYPDADLPLPDSDLIESLGLGHDLGHPPFGHGGEEVLNYLMREYGGFEGNAQTLRLVTHLNKHTNETGGLGLTRRTLLGLLKYPAPYQRTCGQYAASQGFVRAEDWQPPKCYYESEEPVVAWLLEALSEEEKKKFQQVSVVPNLYDRHFLPYFFSFDTSLLNLADDIAYAIHDLEDGIFLGFISEKEWASVRDDFDVAWMKQFEMVQLHEWLFGEEHQRKKAVGSLVHALMCSVIVKQQHCFSEPLFDYRACLPDPLAVLLEKLKSIVKNHFINRHEIQMLEYRGQHILKDLFEALASDPERLLPPLSLRDWQQSETTSQEMRVISDYIASMTDEYATRLYERLFIPRSGSIFDRYY